MADDILFHRRGGLGIATLNRPKALNALTLDMIRAFDRQLTAWEADGSVRIPEAVMTLSRNGLLRACSVMRSTWTMGFCPPAFPPRDGGVSSISTAELS